MTTEELLTTMPSSTFAETTNSTVGTEVVGYCRGPYRLRVNLVVTGAQVGLPTKQPDVLKLPSQSKANKRLSPLCSLITLQSYSKLTASFGYIQIYNKNTNTLGREVGNT